MRSFNFIDGYIFMFAWSNWFLNNEVSILLLESFLEDHFDISVDIVPQSLTKLVAI